MFSKTKPNEPEPPHPVADAAVSGRLLPPPSRGRAPPRCRRRRNRSRPPRCSRPTSPSRQRPLTSGDIQVEGIVEGDIRAHTLVVGESATVKGEVVAEEVIVHGRVIGRLRGLKVRLSTSARCEGDIVHKTIAIESGAHFEGSVQRQDDPLGKGKEPAALRSRRRGDDGRGVARSRGFWGGPAFRQAELPARPP